MESKRRENQADEFLKKLLKGSIGSWNEYENTLKIIIDSSKVGQISFDFDLRIFERGTHGRELLKQKFPAKVDYKAKQRGYTTVTLEFQNCTFQKSVFANKKIESHLTFIDCDFKGEFHVPNVTFSGKVRYRECGLQKINFRNTVFKDLLDFWKCKFRSKVIFYKTDFLGTTSFAASTFKKSVLFTYSLIAERMILRGTIFKNGLDLSVALKSGIFDVFDLDLKDYKSVYLNPDHKKYQKTYEFFVSRKGKIPLNNKRETYRFLKETLESQSNVYESIVYRTQEKKSLTKELRLKLWDDIKSKKLAVVYSNNAFMKLFDLSSLLLNWLSNRHGRSYVSAFVFTALVGWIFFILSLTYGTDVYTFSLNPCFWDFEAGFIQYVKFMLPTHSFDYLGETVVRTSSFYFYDFFGRIFVSYGIYQFVQAFRKIR